jgi:hypothetical protein
LVPFTIFIWDSEQIKRSEGAEMDCPNAMTVVNFNLTVVNFNFFLDRHKIVEGEDPLWDGVSRPYRETIRAFLVYFQNQVFLLSIDLFNSLSLVCFPNNCI